MLKDCVREKFLHCDYNCAEGTLRILNEKYGLGIDEEAMKLVSGFGGGCGCGITCGIVAGCVAAMGKLLVVERAHATPGFKETCGEFCRTFESRFGSTNCAELRPKYFQQEIRCAQLIDEALDCFDSFAEEKGIAPL